MTKSHQSKRKAEALAALKARQRKRYIQFGGFTLFTMAILMGLFWITNRPDSVADDLLISAKGKTWGPFDAPVQIQEWSDYN